MCGLFIAQAQETRKYQWYDPAAAGFNVVEGQGWPTGTEDRYDRLPAWAKEKVRKEVWDLSRNSSGLMIRLVTAADEIRIAYGVKDQHAYQHMPATGVTGVDMYTVGKDGKLLWCAAAASFKDTIEYRYRNLSKVRREYRIYLPIYNTLRWLKVGVPDSAELVWQPARREKPIVVYGTSIAQGACASRPGMAWTAILGRKLDVPVLNLGFSGNGRCEKEVVDILRELDARLFVLDCLPNMLNLTQAEVIARTKYAVHAIREKSQAPIVVAEHAGLMDGSTNDTRRLQYLNVNQWMGAAFDELKREGVPALYKLTKAEIGLGMDMTVDGTHPTDLGMQQYANGFEKCIRHLVRKS